MLRIVKLLRSTTKTASGAEALWFLRARCHSEEIASSQKRTWQPSFRVAMCVPMAATNGIRLSQHPFSRAAGTGELPAHVANSVHYSACEFYNLLANLIKIGNIDRRFKNAVLSVNIEWN